MQTWDGEYADVLAADAFAVCWSTLQGKAARGDINTAGVDPYLTGLRGKMAASACVSPNAALNPDDAIIQSWIQSRRRSSCNADPDSGEARGIDLLNGVSRNTSMYVLPSASVLGVQGPYLEDGMRMAQLFVLDRTELALCMSVRLREQMESADSAFVPPAQMLRLRSIVQERAAIAVHHFASLTKVFAAPAAPFPDVDLYWFLPVLYSWRDNLAGRFLLDDLGRDFALAVQILIENTDELAREYLRQPGAQSGFGTPVVSWYGSDPSLDGPRTKLLALLYGTLQGESSIRNRMPLQGLSANSRKALELARGLSSIPLGCPTAVVDLEAQGLTLAKAIEARLRQQCTGRAAGDVACVALNESTPYAQFLLWKDYGIRRDDVVSLAGGLLELLAGPPKERVGNTWTWDGEPVAQGDTALRSMIHVVGAHSRTGCFALDPRFVVAAYTAEEVQARQLVSYVYPRAVDIRVPGLYYFNPWVDLSRYEDPAKHWWGAVPALAMAKEALAQLSGTATSRFREGTAGLHAVISSAIGKRAALVRPTLVLTDAGNGQMNYTSVNSPDEPARGYDVDLVTDAQDATALVSYGHAQGPVESLARYPDTVGATTAGVRPQDLSTVNLTSGAALADGVVHRSAQVMLQDSGSPLSVLLRTNYPGGRSRLEPIFSSIEPYTFYSIEKGRLVTFGGRWDSLVEDAYKISAKDWSKPAYDAFRLPLDWAPAADASLAGSSRGEEVHKYFLELAKHAAEEAGSAMERAFDGLAADVADDTSLRAAEARGRELPRLEHEAVCGAGACTNQTSLVIPPSVSCLGVGGQYAILCSGVVQAVNNLTPTQGFPLSKPVFDAAYSSSPSTSPTFAAYAGGSLQPLLVDQWSAWKALVSARQSAAGLMSVAAQAVNLAQEEVVLAQADVTAVEAEMNQIWNLAQAQSSQAAAQRDAYVAAAWQLSAQIGASQQRAKDACSIEVMQAALSSSISNGLKDPMKFNCTIANPMADGAKQVNCGTGQPWKDFNDQASMSWGPIYAAKQRCDEANTEATWKLQDSSALVSTLVGQARAADQLSRTLLGQESVTERKIAAARKRVDVATSRLNLALREALVTAMERLSAIELAQAQLTRASSSIDAALQEFQNAKDRIALQVAQDSTDVNVRFGVRRRYRSYDMWRARSLTENARKLAVAARRAMEGRYVVQLSEMNAPEAFVESPARWADEIYGSDLQPFTIGKTSVSGTSRGVSAYNVLDYVRNLELFLNGYLINRPSVQVQSDTEILQFAGPVNLIALEDGRSTVDELSSGWQFWCPNLNRFVGLGSLTQDDTALETLCDGMRPTEARLSFTLDAWGERRDDSRRPAYKERYNIRWRRMALNLVGTGIRDCSSSAQPSECYAEPFLRFSLHHRGPVVISNFDETPRELDIPEAVIEQGKALAIEEWLDPVTRGWSIPEVQSVTRQELAGRPMGGLYELSIALTPDVRLNRIEQVQVLTSTDYWVRQQ